MKLRATIFLCISILFASLRAEAQYYKQLELTAAMDQFRLDADSEGLVSIISKEQDYHYPDGSNKPALPLIRISVLVPHGAELKNYSYSLERGHKMQNVQLARAPSAVPISLMENYAHDNRQYRGSFPDTTLSYIATMIQRGYTWFSFDYSPFEYNGETGELTLIGKIVLKLEYNIDTRGVQPLRSDLALESFIKERIVNPDELEHFYAKEQDYSHQLKSAQSSVDYLIVTSEALKPAFKPLLEWKTRKGLRTSLVTMEEIEQNYDEPSIQLKLKRCLYDYYNDHGLTWVLLGGDSEIVPVQGCYSTARTEYNELIEDWFIPTDLFYACFDKRFDWNSVVDDRIGQIYWDGQDMVPEIYISRVPLKTPDQVEAFVNKTLNYETDPPLQDFFGRLLLSGLRIINFWDGKSDSHHRSERFYETYFKYPWKGEKVGYYDTGSDFPEGSNYDVTAKNLSTQLNSGFGIFHFSGHGDNDYLVMEKGEVFSANDVMNLSNTEPGIVLVNSCLVNAFDSIDPCLSEAFLRNPVGGSIAFFGSSRYGFDNSNVSNELGPSFKYNASFTKYLLDQSPDRKWKSFAAIAAMAKSDFTNLATAGGAMHYLQYAINPIGDPELPLYSSDPNVFDNVRIYKFGNELTVNTGGVEDARICLTSLNLEDGFHELAEDQSFHTFQEIPGSFQVTITAPGFKPYIYRSAGLTSLEENPGIKVNVYPVPAREYLIVELMEQSAGLQFCNMEGRELFERKLSTGPNKLDISEFPEGIYILKITSEKGRNTIKIVKF